MLMQTASQWEPDDKHRQVILALTPAIERRTLVGRMLLCSRNHRND